MLDGESFQKVEAEQKQSSVKRLTSQSILTEALLALLALVNHADKQVALAAKYCVDSDLKLNVAVENVQRRLAEDYSMLRAVLLQKFAAVFESQSFGAPIRVKRLGCVVKVSDIDRSTYGCRHSTRSVARHSDVRLSGHHPVV